MQLSPVTFWKGPSRSVYVGLALFVTAVGLLFASQWPLSRSVSVIGYLDSKGDSTLKAYLYVPTPVVLELTRSQNIPLLIEGFPEDVFGAVLGTIVGVSPDIKLPQEIPEILGPMGPVWEVEVDLPPRIKNKIPESEDLLESPPGDIAARLEGRLRSGLRVSGQIRQDNQALFQKILK